MIPKDSNSFSDGDWDDPEELGWSEADWESYIQAQETVIQRYIVFYEQQPADSFERLDQIARLMDWADPEEALADEEDEEDEADDEEVDAADFADMGPYTVQRNPAFVASLALYQMLGAAWKQALEPAVADAPAPAPAATPAPGAPALSLAQAVAFQAALGRAECQTLLGLHSLDLGDFTLSICQVKRALRELNATMALLPALSALAGTSPGGFPALAMRMLFDLREVHLRVLRECREEIARHPRNGEDDDEGESRPGGAA